MYIDKFDKEQVKNIKYAYKFMRACIENRIDSLSYLDDEESFDLKENLDYEIVYDLLDNIKNNIIVGSVITKHIHSKSSFQSSLVMVGPF